MNVIKLGEKLDLIKEHWTPGIVAELNDQYVKLAKVKGDFVWHAHDDEDELFYVLRGELFIDIEGKESSVLREGEMCVIPKGIRHRPRAIEETWIMLFEPKKTKHTGNEKHEISVDEQKFL